MPCYNAAATLHQTLASLSDQSMTDWELLCIDDGSDDATRTIMTQARATDPRIRPLTNPGKGPACARNLALTMARGDLLAFCDADDLWAPDKLERMAQLMADPRIDGAYARVAFFCGRRSSSVSAVPRGPLSVPMLLGENPVCTMSNLVLRRDVFRSTGGFDATLIHNEDLEWMIRLVAQGHHIVGIPEVLVQYRTSATGLSADLARMRAGRQAALVTAARYGFAADARAEAVYLRHLSRRALRVGAPGTQALRLAASGVVTSPRGFFADFRRGTLTAMAALAAPLMPAPLRRILFAS